MKREEAVKLIAEQVMLWKQHYWSGPTDTDTSSWEWRDLNGKTVERWSWNPFTSADALKLLKDKLGVGFIWTLSCHNGEYWFSLRTKVPSLHPDHQAGGTDEATTVITVALQSIGVLAVVKTPTIKHSKDFKKHYELDTPCRAASDGECYYPACPQLVDNEPAATGRHCPLDKRDSE